MIEQNSAELSAEMQRLTSEEQRVGQELDEIRRERNELAKRLSRVMRKSATGKERLAEYIRANGPVNVSDAGAVVGVSKRVAFVYASELAKEGRIERVKLGVYR